MTGDRRVSYRLYAWRTRPCTCGKPISRRDPKEGVADKYCPMSPEGCLGNDLVRRVISNEQERSATPTKRERGSSVRNSMIEPDGARGRQRTEESSLVCLSANSPDEAHAEVDALYDDSEDGEAAETDLEDSVRTEEEGFEDSERTKADVGGREYQAKLEKAFGLHREWSKIVEMQMALAGACDARGSYMHDSSKPASVSPVWRWAKHTSGDSWMLEV